VAVLAHGSSRSPRPALQYGTVGEQQIIFEIDCAEPPCTAYFVQ
jgi:hypothetical protein